MVNLNNILLVIMVFLFAGCATTRSRSSGDQMQMRVAELEKKLEDKDMEIVDLKYEIKELESRLDDGASGVGVQESAVESMDPKYEAINAQVIRVSATPQEVQNALKNAGVYSGAVDGKLGPRTRKAIETFQMNNGLKADGIVGKNTWEALRKYL